MEKMLRACLNWKVIGGLAVVGLGIWFVAPNLLVAALPVLLIAVCPLSMVLMMRGMQGEHHGSQSGNDGTGMRVAPSRDVQIAARHADPRTTMRYDRARKNLDRHPNYILAAFMASGT